MTKVLNINKINGKNTTNLVSILFTCFMYILVLRANFNFCLLKKKN